VRTLAIGDIHGCFKALSALLAAVSPEPPDQIVFLGDYVDRGDDSRAVLELFLSDSRLKQATFLRGNHEVMMLESRTDRLKAQSWHSFGGFETILSYGAGNVRDWQSAVPQAHWDFLEQTVPFLETDTHIFAHGSVAPDLDLSDQTEWQLFWERFDSLKPHKSGKKVVCGHTPQDGNSLLMSAMPFVSIRGPSSAAGSAASMWFPVPFGRPTN
jgi:serine/threonine protein phosphatase 1